MQVIISHEGADFDAVASMVAVQKLYPEAILVKIGHPDVSVRDFLRLHRSLFPMQSAAQIDLSQVTRIIVVDTRSPARLGPFRYLLHSKNVEVHVYDHHPPTQEGILGDTDVMEALGAAVTVILKRVFEQNLQISAPEATLFLAAIYEETGSLSYPSTTPDDMRAAARLLELGASLPLATQFPRRPLNPAQMELLDGVMRNVKYHTLRGRRILTSALTIDHYVEEAGLVCSRLRDLGDADAVLLVIRMRERVFAVGRSREISVDIGGAFREVGGGGHACAAAASFPGQAPEGIVERLLQSLDHLWSPQATARDVMTAAVDTIALEEHLNAAQALERLREIGHSATVVTQDGKPTGMVTRSDLDKAILHGLGHTPLERYTTSPLISLTPGQKLSQIQRILVERDIGRLPVIEGERLLGIVSRTDVLRSLYDTPQPHATAPGATLADALLRLPERWLALLRRCGELAEREGLEAYAVGGFVRDLILGRAAGQEGYQPDLDIVVEGDGLAFARTLAGEMQAALTQHLQFQTSTLTLPDGLSLDVATARQEEYCRPAALPVVVGSTLKEDLFRRDFSINSMALRLTREHFGELIDFFGGRADLESSLVRVLHNHSFIDDPTRMFRAVRFEQRLHFHLEQNTERLLRQAVLQDRFENISSSRIREELLQCLREPSPLDMLRRLNKLKILRTIYPALALGGKALLWLADVEASLIELGFVGETRVLTYFRVWIHHLTNEERIELRERLALPGDWLGPLASGEEETTTVARIVWELGNQESTPSSVFRSLQNCRPEELGLILCVAHSSRINLDRVKATLQDFILHSKLQKPLLTGHQLQAAGLAPGPRFRELLDSAFDAQLDEGWTVPEEAERWLQALLQSSSK